MLLQFAEHALDAVAVFIAPVVRVGRDFPVRSWRDDGQNAVHEQVFAEPVAVVALVGEQRFRFGQWQRHKAIDGSVVRCLAAGQDKPDRQSLIVTAGVDLARKAAA